MNSMIYMNPRFKWPFNFRQLNINNINNYLKMDNGAHQYKWGCQPKCTEPGIHDGN